MAELNAAASALVVTVLQRALSAAERLDDRAVFRPEISDHTQRLIADLQHDLGRAARYAAEIASADIVRLHPSNNAPKGTA